MVWPAKERAQLGLRHPEAGLLQERSDVAVLELESCPELFQYSVVGDRNLDGLRRSALVFSTLVGDQAIQEMRQDLIAARLVTSLVLFLEECDNLDFADLAATEPDDIEECRITDIQQIADAAKDVVMGHAPFTFAPTQSPCPITYGMGVVRLANTSRIFAARA